MIRYHVARLVWTVEGPHAKKPGIVALRSNSTYLQAIPGAPEAKEGYLGSPLEAEAEDVPARVVLVASGPDCGT